ncbi:MAG: acyl-ACP--UDP-N-acetylglucosamine O-acyltransferase [Veillonella sp.]|nr:acyl-ACP--UDP-N-acetylglucosamine O-acyltransferase [Veillonella sp.]
MIVVGMENAESNIHNTAIVHPNAKLGKDVVIGPGAVIGENVEIGDGTQIGANVVIGGWTTIGKRCEIYPGASIGLEPQDLKFKGEKSYCYRATGEGEETRVGNNCLLQACTHVAHNCIVGNNVIMSNCAGLAGHAIVEDRVVIGGLAGVHQFVKIGRNAMVGGMAKVVQDIPPYVIADGQPARVIGLNSVGLSRAGISEEVRRSLKQAFRIIYRSGFSLSRAIEEMEMQLDSSVEIENLLRFLRNADRGIMRT